MLRAYRYRLYPTPDQEAVLERHCADARFVWNAALEQLNWWRAGGPPSPNHAERSRQLTEAREDLDWLGNGSRTVQQIALRDFDEACRNWWRGTHRRPNWRKRGRHEGFGAQTATLRKLSRKWMHLRIPKAGKVKLRISGPAPQRFDTVRVTRDGKGRWHASFAVEVPALDRVPTGARIGIDRGVTNTLALSNGQMLRAPKAGSQQLTNLQQRLARQRKGSARRERTKRQIAALHQGTADRRRDWIEQRTAELVRDFDLIAVEDLQVANMVRRPAPRPNSNGTFAPNGANAKAGLNRAIHAQGWSHFLRRLTEKAEPLGVTVVEVPPANTSRTCTNCGHIAAENRKSQAVFACTHCGHEAHADHNAAQNILARGIALAPIPGPGTRDSLPARISRSSAARTTAKELAYV